MKYNVTASRIIKAMADAGISQQELANRSGINKSSISHYVNGTHEPGNKAAYALAQALDVDPLWLMGLDVEVHNAPTITVPIVPGVLPTKKVPALKGVHAVQIVGGQIVGKVPEVHKNTIEVQIDREQLKSDRELLRLYHNATPSAQESVMTLLKASQKKPIKVSRVVKKGRV